MNSERIRKGLVEWIGVVVTTCIVCELLARLACPLPEIRNFNRADYTKTAVFGGLTGAGNISNSTSSQPIRNVVINWISDPDRMVSTIHLNLYGFRGPDFRVEKKSGVTRVAVIGDSFTEGFGAQDAETIPAVLQQELNLSGKFEVLNFGVGANNLPEYLSLAADALPIFRPDIVLVVICYNDLPAPKIQDDSLVQGRTPEFFEWWRPRIFEVISEVNARQFPALWYSRGPFPIFRAVPDPSNPLTASDWDMSSVNPKVLEAMRQGRFNPFAMFGAAAVEQNLLQAPGPFERYLDQIKNVSERSGGRMGFVYVPLDATVSDYYYPLWNELGGSFSSESLTDEKFASQSRALAEYSKKSGVAFADMTSAIRQAENAGTHLYVGYDDHMNGQGYTLVAKTILSRLPDFFLPRSRESLDQKK